MVGLTGTEQLIMNCIWNIGEDASVADILRKLKEDYDKDYARTTISVFMSYLRDKGYVAYERRSHAYIYTPLVSREEYKRILLDKYRELGISESPIEFMRSFIENASLTRDDCECIKEMLDEKEKRICAGEAD